MSFIKFTVKTKKYFFVSLFVIMDVSVLFAMQQQIIKMGKNLPISPSKTKKIKNFCEQFGINNLVYCFPDLVSRAKHYAQHTEQEKKRYLKKESVFYSSQPNLSLDELRYNPPYTEISISDYVIAYKINISDSFNRKKILDHDSVIHTVYYNPQDETLEVPFSIKKRSYPASWLASLYYKNDSSSLLKRYILKINDESNKAILSSIPYGAVRVLQLTRIWGNDEDHLFDGFPSETYLLVCFINKNKVPALREIIGKDLPIAKDKLLQSITRRFHDGKGSYLYRQSSSNVAHDCNVLQSLKGKLLACFAPDLSTDLFLCSKSDSFFSQRLSSLGHYFILYSIDIGCRAFNLHGVQVQSDLLSNEISIPINRIERSHCDSVVVQELGQVILSQSFSSCPATTESYKADIIMWDGEKFCNAMPEFLLLIKNNPHLLLNRVDIGPSFGFDDFISRAAITHNNQELDRFPQQQRVFFNTSNSNGSSIPFYRNKIFIAFCFSAFFCSLYYFWQNQF